MTQDGQVYVWGLSGEVSSKQNAEKLFEKCLFKKPTKISFKHCIERDPGSSGSQSNRRKSSDGDPSTQSAVIEDIKMGEYFSIAMSVRGYVYTWGMNDKG